MSEPTRLRYILPAIPPHRRKDVERIVKVFAVRGYEVPERDAMLAWSEHCESEYCAGWHKLPRNDNKVFTCCMSYLLAERWLPAVNS